MHALALDPKVLTDVEIAPPKPRIGDAISPVSIRAWAAMPAADDVEAQAVAPLNLLLLPAEREALQVLKRALDEAKARLTEADAASGRVEVLARALDGLRMRQGELAAKAFTGAVEKAQLDKLMDDIRTAESAEIARPAMREAAWLAREHANRCYGALRVSTRKALEQARCRQATEFERLVSELRRVTAHLGATVDLLGGDTSAWHTVFLPGLQVPALPLGVRMSHAGVESMHYRDMLVKVQHSHLSNGITAASSWLKSQVESATGLPASNLI